MIDAVHKINKKMEVPDDYEELMAMVGEFDNMLGDVENDGGDKYDSEGRWIDPELLAEGAGGGDAVVGEGLRLRVRPDRAGT